jgi:hypothetical protein
MTVIADWFKSKEPAAISHLDDIFSLYRDGQLTALQVHDYLKAFLPAVLRSDQKGRVSSWRPSDVKAWCADTGVTADQVQTVLYALCEGLRISEIIALLTHDASDTLITSATTITGINRYRQLSVISGITLSVDGQPGVIIAKRIYNYGTVAKTPTGGAGGTTPTSPGKGGAGGGGLIIVADYVYGGTFTADGAAGEAGGTTATSGAGGAGGAGSMIAIVSPPGNGGGGAYTTGPQAAGGKPGGGGGGGYGGSYVGGAGGTVSVTAFEVDTLISTILKACVDWWLVNVLGRTPTTTTSFPSCYGAGGGGGGEYDTFTDGGGGGGSGGSIIVVCGSLEGGTYTAKGGAGGNGGAEGSYDAGGGGGGGGEIYIFYKTLVSSPTIIVDGGAAGTSDTGVTAAAAGTAGFGKAWPF